MVAFRRNGSVDFASSAWLKSLMRSVLLRTCCVLALVSVARGQVTWNFDQPTPTGAPTSLPANITGGTITATNATIAFGTTSASSGYSGASGNNNASVTAVTTAFSTSTSTYFSFTLNAAAGVRLLATGFKLGSRSTGSGPTRLALYSSADNFTNELGHVAVNIDSNWAFVTLPNFSVTSAVAGSLTFRLYGSGGTGTAGSGNWRIDDVVLTIVTAPPGPTINTQPVDINVSPGQAANLTVGATGSGTLMYQWRKNGVAIDTTANPSAATATLSIVSAANSDVGSYDVIVTDSLGSLSSTAAALTVGISIVINESTLSAVFDGTPHAVAVTVAPFTLSYVVTYNGQVNNPPTNAGSYAVVATITTPGVTGSASGTLAITQTPQTITINTNPGFAPAVGVPFTVNATASGGTTVRFTATGNATATGTNNATIIATDTSAFTIQATTTGDANNAAVSPGPTLAVTATAPPTISGTYTQNFDNLGTAIPAGWHVFSGATSASLGTDVSDVPSSLVLSATDWNSTTGNFRNVASALNGSVSAADAASTQAGYTSRALGVRQNSSLDPGAAIAFNFKTAGVNVVSVSFSAQLLSAQPNATTWLLQSGVGTSPSAWTTLATFTDPGVFGATPITVTPAAFGTTLNNRQTAWLRIVALNATTFGGTRDTFAIDNFSVETEPVLSITTQPSAQSVTSGQPATFSVAAVGTGALTYQWRRNGVAISGATNAILSLATPVTTDAGSYDAIVADTVGSATSTAAALSVSRIPTTIALSNLTATYDGAAHAVTATPTPAGASIALTYSGAGATPYTASTSPPVNAGTYLVTATVTDAEHQGSTSALFVIGGAPGAEAPLVVTAPVTQTIGYGTTVTLTADVSGSPSPALQWRKDGVAIPGATNGSYTIYGAAFTDAGNYDVMAANAGGTLVSPAAIITVAKNTQTIAFAAPTQSYTAGSGVKLTATASSGLPVVFSIVSGAGSVSGSTLIGVSATVVVRASQPGTATVAAADPVDQTFTFNASGLSPFIISPPIDQTVAAGTTVTFAGTAVGTPVPTYQWFKDGTAIAGATNATLSLAAVGIADAARYSVAATNFAGTATAGATLLVRAAPVITAAPADRTVFAGDNVTLSLSVSGYPAPACQWRKNGTAISGATNATLALANVGPGDSGRYDVIVTNALGVITSTAATVTVNVRDFIGEYFGHFLAASDGTSAAGDFALHARPDGSAVLVGFLPGLPATVAAQLKIDPAAAGGIVINLKLDRNGGFTTTLALISSLSTSVPASSPPTAAAPRVVTLTGNVDDVTGTLTANIPELGLTLAAPRSARNGPTTSFAGYYFGGLSGTATGASHIVVGADGAAYVLVSNGTGAAGLRTQISPTGRILVPNAPGATTGFAALDVTIAGGAASGTVQVGAPGVGPIGSVSIAGASDALAGTQRLANLSLRNVAGVAAAPTIVGFVVTGTAPKQVLIRVAGPALGAAPFNIPSALGDPSLQLYHGSGAIAQNDNWGTPAASGNAISGAAARVGAFPFRNGSADAALLTTLAPGAYSVVLGLGATAPEGDIGAVLAEVYEVLDTAEAPGVRRLGNLSARGVVAPGVTLVAGFVIEGASAQRVLIRGVGPTLAAASFNIAGALPNPRLTLYQGSAVVKTNDDWFRDADAALIRDAAAKAGAFPLGAQSLDAAMLVYLTPGAYTVELSPPLNANTANSTGIALIELYDALP
jgi:hypothetical protein